MAQRRDRRIPPPVGPGVNPNPGGYWEDEGTWYGRETMHRGTSRRGNTGRGRTRRNRNCCDGWEHQMRGGQWMCGAHHGACDGQNHPGNGRSTAPMISPYLPQPWVPDPPGQVRGQGGRLPHEIGPGVGPGPMPPRPGQGTRGGFDEILPWTPHGQPFSPSSTWTYSGQNHFVNRCRTHYDCGLGMQCLDGECVGSGIGPMPGGNNQTFSQQNHNIMPAPIGPGVGPGPMPPRPGQTQNWNWGDFLPPVVNNPLGGNNTTYSQGPGGSMNPGHSVGPHFDCNTHFGNNFSACNNHPQCQVCHVNTATPPYSSSFCGTAGDCHGNGGIGPGPMPPMNPSYTNRNYNRPR